MVSLSGMVEARTLLRIVRETANAQATTKEDSNFAEVELGVL